MFSQTFYDPKLVEFRLPHEIFIINSPLFVSTIKGMKMLYMYIYIYKFIKLEFVWATIKFSG